MVCHRRIGREGAEGKNLTEWTSQTPKEKKHYSLECNIAFTTKQLSGHPLLSK